MTLAKAWEDPEFIKRLKTDGARFGIKFTGVFAQDRPAFTRYAVLSQMRRNSKRPESQEHEKEVGDLQTMLADIDKERGTKLSQAIAGKK